MPEIEIEHTITIRCGKKKWQPATFNVGGNQCIRLTPSHGLTGVVAAFAGIEFTKDDMAVYPSLANAEGFVKMKELRNSAQAAELKPPIRTLFDITYVKANKKPKRSHGQVSGLRACPELFDLTVSGGKSVCMQRPIQNTDNIVIRATDENIRACLECTVSTSPCSLRNVDIRPLVILVYGSMGTTCTPRPLKAGNGSYPTVMMKMMHKLITRTSQFVQLICQMLRHAASPFVQMCCKMMRQATSPFVQLTLQMLLHRMHWETSDVQG